MRIVKGAEQIRAIIFGAPDDKVYHYPAANGTDLAVINLPSLDGT